MKVCLRDSVYSSWKDRNDHTVFGKIALTMNLLDICCIEERLPLIVGSSCYETSSKKQSGQSFGLSPIQVASQ